MRTAVPFDRGRELGWTPITDLVEEIHEGDPSLRRDWPLHYWGLEPLDRKRRDWQLGYASIFRLGPPVAGSRT
jgi:hypothetical protein